VGVVARDRERTLLKVAGSDQSFVLKEDPDARLRPVRQEVCRVFKEVIAGRIGHLMLRPVRQEVCQVFATTLEHNNTTVAAARYFDLVPAACSRRSAGSTTPTGSGPRSYSETRYQQGRSNPAAE
jgi:hypothetical protein